MGLTQQLQCSTTAHYLADLIEHMEGPCCSHRALWQGPALRGANSLLRNNELYVMNSKATARRYF